MNNELGLFIFDKMTSNSVAIVLTATIEPNAILTLHSDIDKRRIEYLRSIEYYRNFGVVFFLENSNYDISSDESFFKYENVHVRKLPASCYRDKGKGFQEFEMLDKWISSEKLRPKRWIKVSGRYLLDGFEAVYSDCLQEEDIGLLIEQKVSQKNIAETSVFYVTTKFYMEHFFGAYVLADDAKGKYIEHVVYDALKRTNDYRLFKSMPLIVGISGSTGLPFVKSRKELVKRVVRNILYYLNNKKRLI